MQLPYVNANDGAQDEQDQLQIQDIIGNVTTEEQPEQMPDAIVTKFNPINLSDQNIPLLSQTFKNITLEEFNFQKLHDNGTYKVIEETRNTLL